MRFGQRLLVVIRAVLSAAVLAALRGAIRSRVLLRTAAITTAFVLIHAAATPAASSATSLPYVACDGRVGIRTSERQTQTDLTADLDLNDLAFQVLDLATGDVTTASINVGGPGVDAGGPLACGGDLFAFGVRESKQQADLNSDGDRADSVLHVFDAATGSLVNAGLPTDAVVASANLIAFRVPEARHGYVDLNGDGDTRDSVLHVFDPATGLTTNVGQEARDDFTVVGSTVAFRTLEKARGPQGTDLNGDGDVDDAVLQIYEASTATLTNSGLQAEPGFQFEARVVAFLVRERDQGLSLNPDPDTRDRVLHLYCLNGSPCPALGPVNLALAVNPRPRSPGFSLAGDLVAAAVSESSQDRTDLNRDDDLRDSVLHVYRLSADALTNTLVAVHATPVISGETIVFALPERNQNRTDFNGDTDAVDNVVHLYDAAAGIFRNSSRAIHPICRNSSVGFEGACIAVSGDFAVFQTRERSQKTDLNGDGDTRDLVVEAWQLSTGVLTSTGVAANADSGLVFGNSIAAFRAKERPHGSDLNGDGDLKDTVITAYDSLTSGTSVLGMQAEALFLVDGDTVVWRTSESAEQSDLNGDGDRRDAILQHHAF